MPVLDKDKVKVYRPGDAVTATVVNDTIDTAINARDRAEEAVTRSDKAEIRSLEAMEKATSADTKASDAISVSNEALTNSNTAKELSVSADSKSTTAIATVRSLEERANNGEFNGRDGRDGSVASAEGMFGFEILDGHLILSYYGDTEPDISIVDGYLILNI
jgi:hypothetical protein